MPDATGLELIAQELRDADAGSVADTTFHRDRATLIVNPPQIKAVLTQLQAKGYTFLASLHGVDYYPEEPRLGVLWTNDTSRLAQPRRPARLGWFRS